MLCLEGLRAPQGAGIVPGEWIPALGHGNKQPPGRWGMTSGDGQHGTLSMDIQREAGMLKVRLAGRLDVNTTGGVWDRLLTAVSEAPEGVRIDASGLKYCDGVGSALLVEMQRLGHERGGSLEITGLAEQFALILRHLDPDSLAPAEKARFRQRILTALGEAAVRQAGDIRGQIAFLGKVVAAAGRILAGSEEGLRWGDVVKTAEIVGAEAVPLIALVSFLVGFVVALDAGDALRPFGADSLTAGFVGTALAKELAPLLSAVILIGRTTSAFAAELGTMRMTEETDALEVMGLDPVPFLVVGRILAAGAMLPLLATFFVVFGLVGGAVACRFFGIGLRLFLEQVNTNVSLGMVGGGLLKSTLYGLLAGGIGCYRGLTSSRAASAVAHSATRAVVTGIIIISVADACFALLFYYLGL
jgi:phospholipid/cholesterol/gamma-HCH transport system permease protein